MLTIKRLKLIKFFSVLFFFFLFLNDHTFYSDYFDDVSSVLLVCSILSFLIVFILTKRFLINFKIITIFFGWALFVIIPCLFSILNRMLFVRFAYWIILFLMLSLLYASKIDFKRIFLIVFKIYCLRCLLGYFYYLFNLDFLPITMTSEKLLYNWFPVSFHLWIFYKPVVEFSFGNFSIIKLYSPFGEPGLVQMYFNFSIIYLLFFKDSYNTKCRKIWLFLFSLSILLSFSLIGIAIMIFSYFIFLLKKRSPFIFIFFLLALLIAVFLILQKADTNSYIQRTKDYEIMLSEITNHFPLGVGLGNISSLDYSSNQINQYYDSFGFYSGLLYPLLQYGIFGIAYYVILIIAICKFSKESFTNFSFMFFIILTLLTQPQAEECFILIFLFDGLFKVATNNNINKISRYKGQFYAKRNTL